MMIGRRRFVNMVAQNCRTEVCSLHRLDVSEHLFYPSTAEAEATKPEVSTLGALPAPTASFQSTPCTTPRRDLFALVSPRSSESRILWSSTSEHTTLYDADSNSSYSLPSLCYKGLLPITISIARPDAPEDDLYVMSSIPYSSSAFEVLRYGWHQKNMMLFPNAMAWKWDSLPPPPPLPAGAMIRSHAVLHGGRTICVTAGGPICDSATYLFDTVEREWSEAPEDLDLPFLGGAEYVPDLKLWLGLSAAGGQNLCASSDLAAAFDEENLADAVDQRKLPTLKYQWQAVETPEEWQALKVSLINLGEGRFCIFKVIHDVPDKDGYDDFTYSRGNLGKKLALLTGVEINSSEGGQLKMVTHKSLSYIFNQERVDWVL